MRRTRLEHRVKLIIAVGLWSLSCLIFPFHGLFAASLSHPSPKYIIFLLADGAGINQLEAARLYNQTIHGAGLTTVDRVFQEGIVGLVTTHSADSLSTDSAAAATALANGCKAKNTVVGICADGSRPLSALEIAAKRGMQLGLVTNSTVYDASPAAFASHVPSRNLTGEILEAYLKLQPAVLLGGGRESFVRRSRTDGEDHDNVDLVTRFRKKGYAYVTDLEGLIRVNAPKVLGLFREKEMSFVLDRDKDQEPSLSDMTREALRILGQRSRGFFLFVENENVDSAGHLSDVASVMQEIREFDRSVSLAYEFYLRHSQETLILVTSDHETGGFAFAPGVRPGGAQGRAGRVSPSVRSFHKIASIQISIRRALEILGRRPTVEDVHRLMIKYFPGFELSARLKAMLLENKRLGPTFYGNRNAAALGAMVGDNTQAYWIGRGHTNQPVFVGALGVGAERFRGYQDNTDLAKHLFVLLERSEKP